MKKLLLLLIIPFLSFGQNRFELASFPNTYLKSSDRFEIKTISNVDLVYEKNSEKAYTGEVVLPFEFGGNQLKGQCVNGLKTGLWEIFKDTIYPVTVIDKVYIKRNSKEADKISEIRNCIVGYDWKYKDPMLNRDYMRFRFYSNGTYRRVLIRGDGWVVGTWSIKKHNSGGFYIDTQCKDSNANETNYPCDAVDYGTPNFLSCSKFSVYNRHWYKDGDDSNEYFYYYKSDAWSPSSTETMEESLNKSLYTNEYNEVPRDTINQEISLIYSFTYNSNGLLDNYTKAGIGCVLEFDDYNAKSINCKKWFLKYNKYGIINAFGSNQKDRYEPSRLAPSGMCLTLENTSKSYPHKIIPLDKLYKKTGRFEYPVFYRYFKSKNDYFKISNGECKEYNSAGELIANFTTTSENIVENGFFNMYNSVGQRIKIQIKSLKEDREKYVKNRRFVSYDIQHTIYDKSNNVLCEIKSEEDALYYAYKEFFQNGGLKKELRFKKDDYFLFKGLKGVDDDSHDWYPILMKHLLTEGYQLFHKKQTVFHENGELKYSVVFKGKSIKEIEKNDHDTNQNYYVFNERYFTYLGEGHEYDKNGKKIRKIYWDQYGRICDRNGKILSNEVLNVNINDILLEIVQ